MSDPRYKTAIPGFSAVEQPEGVVMACEGCAFDHDISACGEVACHAEAFPENHPMSGAERPIIWVRR